jgi:hypothetical protein
MTLVYIGKAYHKLRLPLFYQPPTYKSVPWREIIHALEEGQTVTLRPANAVERAWARELARAVA